jgi:tripartite-type tricarboxylate transporter receptor subunit TctC
MLLRLRLPAAFLLSLSMTMSSWAETVYPVKPIRWIVAYPAGGGSDFLARNVAAAMAQTLHQPVVVENKPGAGGIIGTDVLAKSAPDGYTIATGDNGALIFNPSLYKKLSYSAADVVPVGLMARFPLLLVTSNNAGFGTAQELITQARAAPGKFSFASPGPGSPHHMAMELLKDRAGISMVHVPYKGAGAAMTDLIGGQVPMMMLDTASGMPQIRAGKLKVLAVASRKRLPQLPNVPTLVELGFKDVEIYAWQGMMVPKGTPQGIVDALSAAMQKAMARPDVKRALTDFGLDVVPSDPGLMAAYLALENAFWSKLIKERGLTLE